MDEQHPIERFKLAYRFMDHRWNRLPPEDLAHLHALGEGTATYLAHEVARFYLSGELDASVFPAQSRMKAEGPAPSAVREWLVGLGIPAEENVAVSWDATAALLTRWEIFCRYWNDFCYPSTDDVTVCPIHGGWALSYQREGVFTFGRRGGG